MAEETVKKQKKRRKPRTYGELMEQEQQRVAQGKPPKRTSRSEKNTKVKNKIPNIDPVLLIVLCMLIGTGLLMMFSASYANATYYEGDSFFYVKKQVLYVFIGFVGMFVASRIPYQRYKKMFHKTEGFGAKISTWFPYIAYVIALLMMFSTQLFEARNYAHRWIFIAGISIQPSDIMKFCLILVFAAYVDKHYKDIIARPIVNGVLYYVALFVPVAIAMVLQPHFSGLIIMFLLTLTMMMLGGTRIRYFLLLIPSAALGIVGGVAIKGVGYFSERLSGWIDPMSDISVTTWQTVQSLVCIATGGFWGKGFGNSSQKYLFLPEPQNDFVFAIVCEELGLIGALMIMGMFAVLVWRGYQIALKTKDRFGFMLCAGIVTQIALQVLLNIAVVSNAIPNTGISLPFFSYGGTSLCILMTEMGVVLNISRGIGISNKK